MIRIFLACSFLLMSSLIACAGDLEDGIAAENAQDWDRAIACYSVCLRIKPSEEIFTRRGSCFQSKNLTEAALSDYSSALDMNAEYSTALLYRGILYVNKGDSKKAIGDLTQAIKIKPAEFLAFTFRARAFADTGEFEKAILDYSDAIRLNPVTSQTTVTNRGNIYLKVRDFKNAIKDFSSVIEIDPKNCTALVGRATAYFEMKEFDRARTDAAMAIRLERNNVHARCMHGGICMQIKDYSAAIDDFTTVISTNPKFGSAYLNRGICHGLQGNVDKAISDCNSAIEIDSKDARAFAFRGNCLRSKRDLDRAISDYDAAIRLRGDSHFSINILLLKVECQVTTGDYDGSIKSFSEIIRRDPKHLKSLGGLAEVLSANPEKDLRDGKRAVSLATKACDLTNWRDPLYLSILGAAYAECAEFDLAIKWERAAQEIGFHDASALRAARSRLDNYEAKKPYRLPKHPFNSGRYNFDLSNPARTGD